MGAQIHYFELLKAVCPPYQNFPQTVSEVLGIRINEAYKKIKGISSLNIPQLVALATYFKVPFTFSPLEANTVCFEYLPLLENFDMEVYMKSLWLNMQRVNNLHDKKIVLTTDDIPIFHFFKYPELTSYKMFFWADNLTNTSFSVNNLNQNIIRYAQEINAQYLEMPSVEIWSKDTVRGTLEQIMYGYEAGFIKDKSLVAVLIDQVKNCLTDMNFYAIGGKKTLNPNHKFEWYTCDVLGGISYLIDSETPECYNRFNTFNYLKTSHPFYCLQTKIWMERLISKSIAFSGHGEKHRNQFIRNANAYCDTCLANLDY